MLPHYAPMMLPLHPHSAPWSHDLGRPWLPLTHVLHAHLAAPSASSCFVSCWVTRMLWTVLRPSFRSCQVEPLTCTSWLLRAAEFASACRLSMSSLLNSSTALVLVSLCPWRVFLPSLDIPSSTPCSSTICAVDFPLTNLQPHKSALPIYPTVGMTTSTLRHCFGQPAEVCTLCTFNTVTVTVIMYFLFIISSSTAGFFLCITSRMCLLFLFTLPLWSKINSLEKLKIFIPAMVVNLSNLDLFLLLVVLAILPLHCILPSKMPPLNVAIDILSKQLWPFYIMPKLLPLIGHMPWPW